MKRAKPSIRAAFFSALIVAVLPCEHPLAAEPMVQGRSREGYRYSLMVRPERPAVGDLALVELRLEGVSASTAGIAELRLDSGLKLEAESLRPGGSSLARRADFRFELRVLEPGELRIDYLAIAFEGKTIGLGPLLVVPGAAPATRAGGEAQGKSGAWRWIAPSRAYRYEAFQLRLAPLDAVDPDSAARDAGEAEFALPIGASVEASGRLSWTVIAFEEGELALPEARIGSGSSTGRSKPAKLEIRPLPPELASSRAIGRFRLLLEDGGKGAVVDGAGIRLRLVLEGRGNLPALALPEPDIRLNGAALPRASWSSKRVDECKPEGWGYKGKSTLVLEILPPRAGILSLSFPPFVALDPDSGVYTVALPVREIKVDKSASPASPRESPIRGPGLAAASAAWTEGEKGRALALLYGQLRRAPPLSRASRDAKEAAVACSALLGTSLPARDFLPPPRYFAIAASIVAMAGLSLLVVTKLHGRSPRGRRGGLILLLILTAALAAVGLASAAERRVHYAVIWAETLSSVPSELSELGVSIKRGSTAKLSGYAGKYAGLLLSDGVEGWAPLDSLYFY